MLVKPCEICAKTKHKGVKLACLVEIRNIFSQILVQIADGISLNLESEDKWDTANSIIEYYSELCALCNGEDAIVANAIKQEIKRYQQKEKQSKQKHSTTIRGVTINQNVYYPNKFFQKNKK